MANKFLLALAFLTFHLISAPAFATNISAEGIVVNGGTCSAPPPDSFRITNLGTDYIALAWKPISVGALHDLKVFQENNLGGWEDLGTTYNIAESSYTVTNLESGRHYKFQIATKCPTGDPGEQTITIDGITLILELTTGGRIPLNPTSVNCVDIEYKKYEWVGFRVTHVVGENVISNLFEYKEVATQLFGNSGGITMQIKRVDPTGPNPIVARNEAGFFPVAGDKLNSINPFFMTCLDCDAGMPEEIGRVIIVKNPQTINLCNLKNGTPPWNFDYLFEPLVANRVKSDFNAPNVSRDEKKQSNINELKIQSPVKNLLNIFNLASFSGDSKTTIYLLNSNGSLIHTSNFENPSNLTSIDVDFAPVGFYFLKFESKGRVQVLKFIKSE